MAFDEGTHLMAKSAPPCPATVGAGPDLATGRQTAVKFAVGTPFANRYDVSRESIHRSVIPSLAAFRSASDKSSFDRRVGNGGRAYLCVN
jgi:hypothetical protein